jgi:hypothetical protein
MHLLERYALSCGVKIDKPSIEPAFYPVPFEKYIILHPSSGMESKNYDHYNDVINLILPHLEKEGIKIVQIGGADDSKIKKCHALNGQTSIKQAAFLIKNSMLVVGNDSFSAHMASGLNVKSVTLYNVLYKECCSPYWSNEAQASLIESHRNGNKASFSDKEDPKTINYIYPEKIACAILDKLNISHDLHKIETLHIGKYYHLPVIEVIPDFNALNYDINRSVLNVRMDYHFDENNLFSWAQNKKLCIITNKPVSQDCLRAIQPSIAQLIYKPNVSTTSQQLQEIKELGIELKVIADEEEHLEEIRLNLLEWQVEIEDKKSKKDVDNNSNMCDNTRYISSKIMLSKGKKYASKAAWKRDIDMTDNQANIIDNPDFWDEVDHFRIFNYA